MKILMLKLTEAVFVAAFSLIIIAPLSLIYAIGVGVFQFGSAIIQDFNDLITYNKSVWK